MKPTTTAVYDEITNSHHNNVGAVVHAEWKMNRFYRTAVDNTPKEDDEGYDIEVFPIDSITKPNRPTAGIAKAVAGMMTAAESRYEDAPGRRFYVADQDDVYKYWSSPSRGSETTGAISGCAPQVLYVEEDDVAGSPVEKNISVNKIHFTVENSVSTPETYSVQVKTKTGSWTTVATQADIEIPASGLVELWYNGTGWTTTENLDYKTSLSGVRIVVTKMRTNAGRSVTLPLTTNSETIQLNNGSVTLSDIGSLVTGAGIPTGTRIKDVTTIRRPYAGIALVGHPGGGVRIYTTIKLTKKATQTGSKAATIVPTVSGGYFNLIELGLALEQDLSADLVSWSDTFNMGEKDFITPLGTISSNEGSINLWNGDERYRNSNPNSDLYGILDKGVKFVVWSKYAGGNVQEFELYSDGWTSGEEETSVTLIDQSNFFMEAKPRPVIYRNIPVQEAVWRICDQIGFSNYLVTDIDKTAQAVIDVFWTDGEKTAWEIFGELARATQTAIYFDSFGVLNIKTRKAAWDKTQQPKYTFLGESVPGSTPANIEEIDETNEYEANKVSVNWTPTSFSQQIENVIPQEVVWEPEGNVVLRASRLRVNLPATGTNSNIIYLNAAEGKTWPFSGIVQVEGEFISYDAKGYTYVDAKGVRNGVWVKSLEEQEALDNETGPWRRHLNSYSGALRVKERGLWNTPVRSHTLDMAGWTKTRRYDYNSAKNVSPCGGIYLKSGQSTLNITGPNAKYDEKDYTYVHRGSSADTPLRYIGTRMRIDKTGHKHKQAGIYFSGGGVLGAGYYLDVMATSRMTGSMRATRNEILFYSMKADGTKKTFGGDVVSVKSGKTTVKKNIGEQFAVVQGNYINFDIYVYGSNAGTQRIQIWANGTLVLEANIAANDSFKHDLTGKFGMYVVGHSSATFEYIYGTSGASAVPDAYAYYNNIAKVWESNQWLRDWVYETRTVRRKVRGKWKKVQQRYGQRYFEEFGPIVNEVREFDVKFKDNKPVIQSKLYSSNSQGVVMEYVGNATNAKFVIANAARENVVLSGEQASVNHKLFVYGRPAIQKEPQKIEKTDEWAVRRRGIIETEYNSPWTQNKAEAEALATWLTQHWSRSDSTLKLKVFGNPLVEITDLVRVKIEHIDANYYVTEVSNEYGEEGLSTSLTLRKA